MLVQTLLLFSNTYGISVPSWVLFLKILTLCMKSLWYRVWFCDTVVRAGNRQRIILKCLSRLSLPRFFTFYRSPITNFFLCLVSPLHFLFPSLFFFFEAASLNFCFFSGGGFIIVVTVIELSGMEKANVWKAPWKEDGLWGGEKKACFFCFVFFLTQQKAILLSVLT